jgi:hypothetical protein
MPRRGLFGRIADGLGKIFKGLGDLFGEGAEPAPPAPPPAPPRPPVRPPPVEPPPEFTRETQIWREIAKGRDRYDSDLTAEWFELYRNAVEPVMVDEEDFWHFWGEFLRAFYLTTAERGHLKRDDFYQRIGIRKRDFEMDWETWRELKRGTP